METSSTQEILFTRIHDDYERHYFDSSSLSYRERFIYDPLFFGIDFNYSWVADLACSSGYTSVAIKQRFSLARTCGFELSPSACVTYRQTLKEECFQLDLTKPFSKKEIPSFDHAVLIGGLHHCVNSLDQTLANIAKLVKPGGFLFLAEPNADFILEPLRKIWYHFDKKYIDHSSERALYIGELTKCASPYFQLRSVRFIGGPAYFFVLNSLILRVPLKVKQFLFKPLMKLEKVYQKLTSPILFPYFLSRWERI